MHKTGAYAFGGLDVKRQAAFNAAIENAVRDPEYAAKLTAEMGRRGRYMTPARALVQSVYATLPAALAGTGVPQSPANALDQSEEQ